LRKGATAIRAESNLDTLGELYRASHDLKGQASTFDFPLVARVASSLCKLTDDVTNALELPLALINAHVDAIKVIVREGVKDPTHQTGTVLAGELEKQVGAFLDKSGRA
jgi:chemotaxis protein histidine kinase CheA